VTGVQEEEVLQTEGITVMTDEIETETEIETEGVAEVERIEETETTEGTTDEMTGGMTDVIERIEEIEMEETDEIVNEAEAEMAIPDTEETIGAHKQILGIWLSFVDLYCNPHWAVHTADTASVFKVSKHGSPNWVSSAMTEHVALPRHSCSIMWRELPA
jgi:hypothetical protein